MKTIIRAKEWAQQPKRRTNKMKKIVKQEQAKLHLYNKLGLGAAVLYPSSIIDAQT